MPNRNYVNGRALEYKRKKHWENQGYKVLRTAGSHGEWDLILYDHACVPTFIQIKRCATEAEAVRLCKKFHETTKPAFYYCQMMECHVVGSKHPPLTSYVDCTAL